MPHLQVARTHVVQLIGFETLADVVPTLHHPEVDARAASYAVGMTPGSTISVRMVRLALAPDAPLTARSASGHVTIASAVPAGVEATLRITANASDADVQEDRIEISWNDHVLGSLEVHIYRLIRIPTRFHFVYAASSKDLDTARSNTQSLYRLRYVALTETFQMINAIWRPAGIEFVHPGGTAFEGQIVVPDVFDENRPRLIDPKTDLESFLRVAPHEATAINFYFVHRVEPSDHNVDGKAYPVDPWDDSVRAPRPCVIVPLYRLPVGATPSNRYDDSLDMVFPGGDSTPGLDPEADRRQIEQRRATHLATTLAHELGHYLGLRHPHDASSFEEWQQGWTFEGSKALLMHNQIDGRYLIPIKRHFSGPEFTDNGVDAARETAKRIAQR